MDLRGLFRLVHATLSAALLVGQSVRWSVGPSLGHCLQSTQLMAIGLVSSLPIQKMDKQSGHLGGIFGCCGALRGALELGDEPPQEGERVG